MGRGLGLCYHARSSYQEAQVGSDSDVDYILLFVSLSLTGAWHGLTVHVILVSPKGGSVL